jgi:hypothetical protein
VPWFRDRFRFLASMRHKSYKRMLLARPFGVCAEPAEIPGDGPAAVVTDRRWASTAGGVPLVFVRYDRAWPRRPHEVPLGVSVPPELHDGLLGRPLPDLEGERPWRIFFSGASGAHAYSRDLLPRRFGKLSRPRILALLPELLPRGRLVVARSRAQLAAAGSGPPAFVLASGPDARVPQAEWLDTLARADFFLACPGKMMPLCHSLIESLAVGTVPILEHPEYLDPPLAQGVNCLAFQGEEGLARALVQALEMRPAAVARLRRGAHAYYSEHLAPGRFARRLLDLPYPRVELRFNACRTPRPGPAAGQPLPESSLLLPGSATGHAPLAR